MTVPEGFGFRTVTELLGLTDNLPISLQLLLSASAATIAHSCRIAITHFRTESNSLRRDTASSQSAVARARSSVTALNSRFTTTARPGFW